MIERKTIKTKDFKARLYANPSSTSLRTGVLWLHGGGYATGMADMFWFTRAKDLVEKFDCVVLCPEYSLSWKKPYPAALNESMAALVWMKDHAKELDIRSDQIFVGGESAGGGLTIAVCLKARDTRSVSIAFALPLYPMLDDRDTDTSVHNWDPVWNTYWNHMAWHMYLGKKGADSYAAPARAEDLEGLPPMFTMIGRTEPFYRETETFFHRLKEAGVPCQMDVWPGWHHAYDLFHPFSRKTKTALDSFYAAFKRAQETCFARQPQ